MSIKREKLIIINRSFWPIYPVIGEALLRFAERHAQEHDIGVILQDHANIREKLTEFQRGKNVNFYPCKAWSISGSSVARRALDSIFFMAWVFIILIWKRPSKIYISTDPPVLVPFIVCIYSKIFKANFIYHLQDIHPEATNVVIKLKPWLFKFLQKIDAISMRQAEHLITITEEMAHEIKTRSHTKKQIFILSNPSIAFDDVITNKDKEPGFVFCGNAGRLQRIPLLISSIKKYVNQGGILKFIFAGGGVYAEDLKNLANELPKNVIYHGLISPTQAAQLNYNYEWALLPIEDEVTRYAFPSKSSSYVFSGAKIIAICSKETSVAQWILKNNLGIIIEPSIDSICDIFSKIEKQQLSTNIFDINRDELKKQLSFDVFLNKLSKLIFKSDT